MIHYAAIHMRKFTHSQLGGVLAHDFRKKENYGSNPDIDKNRTKNNLEYKNPDVASRNPDDIIKFIDDRAKATTGRVNSRSVLINEFIITSDKEAFNGWDEKKLKQFEIDSLNFFNGRYGKSNVAYASLHLDEKTPHIHLGVMPITKDNQLNSKKIFDRNELISLQKDFVSEVGSKYGLVKGDGKGKHHYNTKDFKRMTNYMSDKQKTIKYGNFLNQLYKNPDSKKGLMQEIHKLKSRGALKNSFLDMALNSSSCGGAIGKDPYWQELEEEERKRKAQEQELEEDNERELDFD